MGFNIGRWRRPGASQRGLRFEQRRGMSLSLGTSALLQKLGEESMPGPRQMAQLQARDQDHRDQLEMQRQAQSRPKPRPVSATPLRSRTREERFGPLTVDPHPALTKLEGLKNREFNIQQYVRNKLENPKWSMGELGPELRAEVMTRIEQIAANYKPRTGPPSEIRPIPEGTVMPPRQSDAELEAEKSILPPTRLERQIANAPTGYAKATAGTGGVRTDEEGRLVATSGNEHAMESLLTEEQLSALERIPLAGTPLRHQAEFLTSPFGAGVTGLTAGLGGLTPIAEVTAGQLIGGTVGYGAEELGAPRGTGLAGEVIGGVRGPAYMEYAAGKLGNTQTGQRIAGNLMGRPNIGQGPGGTTIFSGQGKTPVARLPYNQRPPLEVQGVQAAGRGVKAAVEAIPDAATAAREGVVNAAKAAGRRYDQKAAAESARNLNDMFSAQPAPRGTAVEKRVAGPQSAAGDMLITRLEQRFGTTKDITSAGFITPNGDLIDLGPITATDEVTINRLQDGDPRAMTRAGKRVSHETATEIYGEGIVGPRDFDNRYPQVYTKIMHDTGVVKIRAFRDEHPTLPGRTVTFASVEVAGPLTPQQVGQLRRLADSTYDFYVSTFDPRDGRRITDPEIQSFRVRTQDDLKDYVQRVNGYDWDVSMGRVVPGGDDVPQQPLSEGDIVFFNMGSEQAPAPVEGKIIGVGEDFVKLQFLDGSDAGIYPKTKVMAAPPAEVRANRLKRAEKYVEQVQNPAMKRYAQALLEWKRGGSKGEPPIAGDMHPSSRAEVERAINNHLRVLPPAEVEGRGLPEPTVGRARMTESGKVVEEDTFATEREIGGIREKQGAMFEGQGPGGTMSLKGAGPMFDNIEEPPPSISTSGALSEGVGAPPRKASYEVKINDAGKVVREQQAMGFDPVKEWDKGRGRMYHFIQLSGGEEGLALSHSPPDRRGGGDTFSVLMKDGRSLNVSARDVVGFRTPPKGVIKQTGGTTDIVDPEWKKAQEVLRGEVADENNSSAYDLYNPTPDDLRREIEARDDWISSNIESERFLPSGIEREGYIYASMNIRQRYADKLQAMGEEPPPAPEMPTLGEMVEFARKGVASRQRQIDTDVNRPLDPNLTGAKRKAAEKNREDTIDLLHGFKAEAQDRLDHYERLVAENGADTRWTPVPLAEAVSINDRASSFDSVRERGKNLRASSPQPAAAAQTPPEGDSPVDAVIKALGGTPPQRGPVVPPGINPEALAPEIGAAFERIARGQPPQVPVAPEISVAADANARLPRKTMEVMPEELTFRPELFQARRHDPGKAFMQSRVDELKRIYDEAEVVPPVAVRDSATGELVVIRGHHTTETLRQLFPGQPVKVQVIEGVDLNNPDDMRRLVVEAVASNFATAESDIGEKVNGLNSLIAAKVPIQEAADQMRITMTEAERLLDIGRMGEAIINRVSYETALEPIAFELGRGRRLFGINEEDAAGWFNMIAEGPKGQRPTQSTLREVIDKFGAQWEIAQASRQFEGFTDLGGQRGGVLELLDTATRKRKELQKAVSEAANAEKKLRRMIKRPGRTEAEIANLRESAEIAVRDREAAEVALAVADEDVAAAFRAEIERQRPSEVVADETPIAPVEPMAGAPLAGFEGVPSTVSGPATPPPPPPSPPTPVAPTAPEGAPPPPPSIPGARVTYDGGATVPPPPAAPPPTAPPGGAGRVPPFPPKPPRDAEPPPFELEELGNTEIQRMIDHNSESLLRPGPLTRLVPGEKSALTALGFPVVDLDETVHVAFNAAASAAANVVTRQAHLHDSLADEQRAIARLWTPKYNGDKRKEYKRLDADGKLTAYLEEPGAFDLPPDEILPRVASLQRLYAATEPVSINALRSGYGVDYHPVRMKDPEGTYIPRGNRKDAMDKQLLEAMEAYTVRAGTSSVTKTRAYETVLERMSRDPSFVPETDPRRLWEAHDRGLAYQAALHTLKKATGGITLTEAKELVAPALVKAKTELQKDVANLKRRIETATNRMRQAGAAERRMGTRKTRLAEKIDPIHEKIARLGEEWGPELSFLSGQVRELEAMAREAEKALTASNTRRAELGMSLTQLRAEYERLSPRLAKLVRAYEATNVSKGPNALMRSDYTNLYHPAKVATDIGRVMQTKLGYKPADQLVSALREATLVTIGGDLSPFIFMQGLFGHVARPSHFLRTLTKEYRQLRRGDLLREFIEQNPTATDLWTMTTKRAIGEPGIEFRETGKGLERVPGVRGVLHRFSEAVFVQQLESWWDDTQRLVGTPNPRTGQPHTWSEAAAESWATWSKIMPTFTPPERGMSNLRARLENLPFFSSAFVTAPPGLLKDATAAVVRLMQPTTASPVRRWHSVPGRERLALERVLKMAVSLATLAAASYALSDAAEGKPPNPKRLRDVFNPNSPRFISFAIPGTDEYLPIGGPFRSFIKAMAPQSAYGSPKIPFGGLPKYVEARLAPVVRVPKDLAENRDYFNRTIRKGEGVEPFLRSIAYAIESFAPIPVQPAITQFRTSEVETPWEIARQLGIQLLGGSLHEESPGVKRNQLSRDRYGADYFDLDVDARARADEDADIIALSNLVDTRQRDREDEHQMLTDKVEEQVQPYREQQALDDRAFESGLMQPDDWKEANRIRQAEVATLRQTIFSEFDFSDDEADPVKQPIRVALQRYFETSPSAFQDPVTRQVNWDEFFLSRDRALSGLSPQQKKAAQAEITKNMTDTQRDFREASLAYGNIRRTVPKYRDMTVADAKKIDTFRSQVTQERERRIAAGEYPPPPEKQVAYELSQRNKTPGLYRWFDVLSSTERRSYFINPAWDAALLKDQDLIERWYPDLYATATFQQRIRASESGGVGFDSETADNTGRRELEATPSAR